MDIHFIVRRMEIKLRDLPYKLTKNPYCSRMYSSMKRAGQGSHKILDPGRDWLGIRGSELSVLKIHEYLLNKSAIVILLMMTMTMTMTMAMTISMTMTMTMMTMMMMMVVVVVLLVVLVVLVLVLVMVMVMTMTTTIWRYDDMKIWRYDDMTMMRWRRWI